MKSNRLAVLFVGLLSAAPMWCQSGDAEEQGRGVARISVLNGDVSVLRGDSGDTVAAAINAPLVVQDRVLSGAGSRAEIQLDYANFLRVGEMSEVRFSELENNRYQVQVARGTVTFRVLRDSRAEVEVSTPNISVRPLRKGTYRVTVNDDGTTEVTVRSGEADIFTPHGSELLKGGRTMVARGNAADPEFQILSAIRQDSWDRWNEQRDQDLSRASSYDYVSRDIYGAEDLDNNGSWVQADNYGWVWAPRVAVGWAPYRDGRWVWVDYYGWTWVSYDPWGWAPYHYGRWFNSPRYGWCWWPGAVGGRHYWSPGLVAFFGWGGHGGGFGVGFGNVGWVPLAPYETYHPWYGRNYYGGYRNQTITNNVHVVNNVNITNVYRNARVTNGITGTSSDQFARGNGRYGRVAESDIRSANLARGPLPVTPTRDSLRMSDRQVHPSALPQTREDRSFFSRRQATQVERIPFEQQRRGIEQISRRSTTDTIRTAETPANRGAASNNAGRGTMDNRSMTTDSGARRSEQIAPRTAGVQPTQRQAESDRQSGWRRFGTPGSGQDASGTSNRAPAAASGRSADRGAESNRTDNGWKRFGEPAATRQSDQPSERGNRGVTERFGQQAGSSDSRGQSRVERSAPATEQRYQPPRSDSWNRYGGQSQVMEQPRIETQRNTPRMESSPRSERQSRSSEPIRISPPIVQQRSAPAMERRSAPAMERRSAPAMEQRSAPPPRSESAPSRSESRSNAPAARDSGGGRGGESRGGRGR
jgi:hypothetical protein